jgi:hypothetical protein
VSSIGEGRRALVSGAFTPGDNPLSSGRRATSRLLAAQKSGNDYFATTGSGRSAQLFDAKVSYSRVEDRAVDCVAVASQAHHVGIGAETIASTAGDRDADRAVRLGRIAATDRVQCATPRRVSSHDSKVVCVRGVGAGAAQSVGIGLMRNTGPLGAVAACKTNDYRLSLDCRFGSMNATR